MSVRAAVKRAARPVVPALLLRVVVRRRSSRPARLLAGGALVALWTAVYSRYRAEGKQQTAREYELLRTATDEAFWRHYNEHVPTVKEEFELWGPFHQHRHEMRYDLVAGAVRSHLPRGGTVLDVGCGAGLVAERIPDIDATYIGLDFPAHHIAFAASSLRGRDTKLQTAFVRGDGERLPVADSSVDVVVLTEVIEHLKRPELAVWEISRVLRRGGVFIMTTNNASEVPLRSPLSHAFAWLEKALGANRPELISLRPWVWPVPVHESLLPPGSPPVYLPHTHHISAETRAMFAAAGMATIDWSTFEFPPPQAATTAWLERRGAAGRRVVDAVERVAQALPLVNRLGCHLFVIARKDDQPASPAPPPGVWPGPFSDGRVT